MATCSYNLTEIPPYVSGNLPMRDGCYDMVAIATSHPGTVVWSGAEPPPPVGARVVVTMNDFGPSTVTGYFVEHGFLGLHVRPDKRPKWHREQQPGRDVICVFGVELKGVRP